ncbi:hypothetical protein GQ53DRAFT_648342, partial [Thozetella sp. PMI_491]
RLASGSDDETIKIWDPTTGQCMATLEIGYITSLNFDVSAPRFLYTSVGSFDLGSTIMSRSSDTNTKLLSLLPQAVGYGLNIDKTWVTYQGQGLLWLPSDYRPQISDILRGDIALGYNSGLVSILGFTKSYR